MVFERYHAADLGRFRISVTADARVAEAGLPPAVESALLVPEAQRTQSQRDQLMKHFLSVAPELAAERDAVKKLLDSRPAFPTALAFEERPANNPRPTFVHHRGEFLQPTDEVEPGVLAILPQPPPGARLNRLIFAKWLVDTRNPLTARVTVNRQWQAFFGQEIVRTLQDFGYQGDPPTHPELLDWLAVQFMRGDRRPSTVAHTSWSLKALHRLIVTSATYRQSSRVTPELRQQGPGEPPVSARPALPAGCGASSRRGVGGMRSAFRRKWVVPASSRRNRRASRARAPTARSPGSQRGRRQIQARPLYFLQAYGPVCNVHYLRRADRRGLCPRREVSNTPLQALTMLNDQVFVEAAQALGKDAANYPGTIEQKAEYIFRRCATRPPDRNELALLVSFYENQRQRFSKKELNAEAVAGKGEGDVDDRAAWTTLRPLSAESGRGNRKAVTRPLYGDEDVDISSRMET